jgi:hypothetical protein
VCLLSVVSGLVIAALILAAVFPLMQVRVSPAAAWIMASVYSMVALIAGVRVTRSRAP